MRPCAASAEGLKQDSCCLQTRASCALSLIVRLGCQPLGSSDQVPDMARECTSWSRETAPMATAGLTRTGCKNRTDQAPPALSQQWSSRALSVPVHMREGPQQWDHAAARPSPALLRPPAPGWLPALQGVLSISCTRICITCNRGAHKHLDMAGSCCPCASLANGCLGWACCCSIPSSRQASCRCRC